MISASLARRYKAKRCNSAPSPNWSPSGGGMSQCETQFEWMARMDGDCMDDDCGRECQAQVVRVLPMCYGHEQTDIENRGRVNIKQFLEGMQQKCGGFSPGRSPSGGGGMPSMSPPGGGGMPSWSPTPSWPSPSGGGRSPTPNWSPSGGVSQCETQFMVGAQVCMNAQDGECG